MPITPPERDDRLREYATDRQWEVLEAVWTHGGQRQAAAALGVQQNTVRTAILGVLKKASRRGYIPAPSAFAMTTVPKGFVLKGQSALIAGDGRLLQRWDKTREEGLDPDEAKRLPDPKWTRRLSTLTDSEGRVVQQWHTEEPRAVDRAAAWEELTDRLIARVADRPALSPIAAPASVDDDLSAVYNVGDHHIGMYSWARETGANWDLNIATRTLRAAFDHLIGGMPATGHALISFIGDLFDYDGMEPVTPTSRNILDVDGRFMKMAELGIDAILYAIDRTLSHHSRVEIKFVPGNHDPSLMRLMSLFVRTIYRDEPRVSVDVTPGQFRYHRFGKNLRGFCHGHEVKKLSDLALIMATDRPDDWAASTYRTWHTGHRHKHEILDEQGVRIETAPVLCPLNAWAHSNGFRGLRAMQAILQHREDGEIARFTVNPSMMR